MAATGFAYTRSGDRAGAVHPIPLSNEGEDVKGVKTRLIVAALLKCCLAACSQGTPDRVKSTLAAATQAAVAQLPPTPTSAVSVTAVELVRKPAVRRVVATRPKVRPVTVYRKPIVKPKHFVCYIG